MIVVLALGLGTTLASPRALAWSGPEGELLPAPAPPPPPPPTNAVGLEIDTRPARDLGPAPSGGHPLGPWQVGMTLELGFPFLAFRVALGLPGKVELEAGYRGVYGLTNAVFAGLKLCLWENQVRRTAVSLRLIGGYGEPRRDPETFETNAGWVGGAGGFGELALRASSRAAGRRVSFEFGFGLRLSEYFPPPCSNEDCERSITVDGELRGVIPTTFLELGLAYRIGLRTSYFAVIGVDIFSRAEGILPAMLRFRNGIAVDF